MEIILESIVNFIEPSGLFMHPWEYGENKEKTISLNKLTVKRVVNLFKEKKIVLEVKELRLPITLWEGDSYMDSWTDLDIENRVKEIYKK